MQRRRALHPAPDYCHPCLRQGPALAHPSEDANGLCTSLELSPNQHEWRVDASFPFQLDLPENGTGAHDHHIPYRRQVYLGPTHCTVPELFSPPCYAWREVRVPRWDSQMHPCACVWQRPSQCGCVQEWHYHGMPHPFHSGPMLGKFRDPRYYREPRYVSGKHYSDCPGEGHASVPDHDRVNRHTHGFNGHFEKHVTFEDYDDDDKRTQSDEPPHFINNHCNGTPAFFPTEVPQSKLGSSRVSGPRLPVNGSHRVECRLEQENGSESNGNQETTKDQRKSQGTVREKIKRVVTELEDVLSGLKQVQVEMKEVVQQIDILTSNIDLNEEHQGSTHSLPQEPRDQVNRIGVVALVHNTESESPAGNVPRTGVKSWTTRSLSAHSLVAISSSRISSQVATKTHTNLSDRGRGFVTSESADGLSHMSATENHRTKSISNGHCLKSRPPSGKLKESQHQRTRTNHTAISKTPSPPFPIEPVVLAKTQRPPYAQNGLVKRFPQDSNQPPNDLTLTSLPEKQKQLNSTMV